MMRMITWLPALVVASALARTPQLGAAGQDIAGSESKEATLIIQLEMAVPGPLPRPQVELLGTEVIAVGVGTSIGRNYMLGQTFARDGRLEATVPPGTDDVVFERLPDAYVLESLRAGSTDLLTSPLILEPGSTEIHALLATNEPNPWSQVGDRIVGVPAEGYSRPLTVVLSNAELFLKFEANIDPKGAFVFDRVPPGSYTVGTGGRETGRVVSNEPTRGTADPTTSVTVTVGKSDVLDLDLRFEPMPGGVVVVRGFAEERAPVPRFRLGLGRYGSNSFGGGRLVPEGDLDVEVGNVPAGYFVKGVRSGATDLQAEPLRVLRNAVHSVDVWFGVEEPVIRQAVRGTVSGLQHLEWVPDRVVFSSSNYRSETLINADGTFEVDGLLPGRYIVSMSSGRFPVSRGAVLRRDFVVEPNAERAERAAEIELAAPRTVSGRVLVDSSQATSVRLRLQRRNEVGETLGNVQVGADFTIDVFEGETIHVSNLPLGFRLEGMSYGSLDPMTDPIRFEENEASMILVQLAEVPATPSNPGFTVRGRIDGLPRTGASIFGKIFGAVRWLSRIVTGRGSSQPPNVHVRLRYDEPNKSFDLVAPVSGDGFFTFRALPPGPYHLWIDEATHTDPLARVVVSDSDVVDIRLKMPEAVAVEGWIVTADGSVLPDLSSTLFVVRATTSYFPYEILPGGRFRATLSDGDRFVFLDGLPEGYSVESIRYGSSDLTTEALRLDASVPISPMEIVVRRARVEWRSGDRPGAYLHRTAFLVGHRTKSVPSDETPLSPRAESSPPHLAGLVRRIPSQERLSPE